MRTFNIKTPDKKIVPALQDKIDNLTKPKGSLGRLEELAVRIGTIQQSLSPVLRTPQNIVFAADHGVVVEGVSFSAPEVTAQQIYNFLKGGGGINMFARQHHFILKVVDCGVNADFGDLPGLIHRKIRKSTDNYLYGPAMTPEEMERAIEIGAEMVQLAYQEGTNIISFGELGMANTSASSVWMYFFTGIPLKECVGAGSGLDNQGIEHKYQVLKRATDNYQGNGTAEDILRWFGGFEMVAAAQESKRLGLCNKSLFVVPNHLTEQWAAEYLQLYPAANILVATKKDFETKNRKKFCGRIATGDYDAVIIGHSQFEKIPMSIERQRAILEQQLEEITEGIAELKRNRGENFSLPGLLHLAQPFVRNC